MCENKGKLEQSTLRLYEVIGDEIIDKGINFDSLLDLYVWSKTQLKQAIFLRVSMEALVSAIKGYTTLLNYKDKEDIHLEICNMATEQFALWDDNDCFPIWLSRIVAGVISDEPESEVI